MKKILVICLVAAAFALRADELDEIFANPPESAKPGALWMWMGCNLSSNGITRDLEALKKAGFNRTTMFSLADVTTPWACEIRNSPTPEIVAWTEPWWKLVRFAALESKRLGMDFGMHNCPGYTASGGPWIPPELSMQQICFSQKSVNGPGKVVLDLPQPQLNCAQFSRSLCLIPTPARSRNLRFPNAKRFTGTSPSSLCRHPVWLQKIR